jgi:hypothetical protein
LSTGSHKPDWKGRTVVCIASGPSLTAEDCELVRKAGHPVIVTNTTFRLCPWADVLFGFDAKWWRHYASEVAEFKGRKVSASPQAEKYGVENPFPIPWFSIYRNSGCCAVSIAIAAGASKVIMLGYDCGFIGKRRHWHGDHPKGMDNAGTLLMWQMLFGVLAKQARRAEVKVANASRRTTLKCFERVQLEDVL